jgi:hypothetical protein
VAVEVRGSGSGRIRMQVIDDASADTLCDFVAESIAAGATVRTDGWSGYKRLARLGFDHQPPAANVRIICSARTRTRSFPASIG